MNTNDNLTNSLMIERDQLMRKLKSSNSSKVLFIFLFVLALGLGLYTFFVVKAPKVDPSAMEKIEDLESQVATLEDENEDLKTNTSSTNSGSADCADGEIPSGNIYTVQFKSLTNKIKLMSGKFLNLKQSQGKYHEYSIGIYDNQRDAVVLRDQLEKLGFRDAFVVVFQGDRKVLLKDLK